MNIKYILFLSIALLSCSNEPAELEEQLPIKQEEATSSLVSSKIIFNEGIGWGYQIFEGSKMIINQEHIPAVQGMHGFSSKEKAVTAANYVVNKIENGIFPPTLTPEELDSLGVYSDTLN